MNQTVFAQDYLQYDIKFNEDFIWSILTPNTSWTFLNQSYLSIYVWNQSICFYMKRPSLYDCLCTGMCGD